MPSSMLNYSRNFGSYCRKCQPARPPPPPPYKSMGRPAEEYATWRPALDQPARSGRVFSSGTEIKAPPHKCPKAWWKRRRLGLACGTVRCRYFHYTTVASIWWMMGELTHSARALCASTSRNVGIADGLNTCCNACVRVLVSSVVHLGPP